MLHPHAFRTGLALLTLVAGGAWAKADGASLESFFTPARVAQAALAPDGRHVAFALRNGGGLELMVWDLAGAEPPGRIRLDPRAGADLDYLGWSSPSRLIAVPRVPLVLAVDLGSRRARSLIDEKSLATVTDQRRSGRATLRVLGLDRRTGTVTLEVQWMEGRGDVVLDVVSVPLESGAPKLAYTRRLDAPGGLLLADRQGRPRVLFDRGAESSRYLHLPPEGDRGGGVPLDQIWGERRSGPFRITPENLLGERAIPLGFGADPSRLYVASNVDRDRFGLEVLDLATGTREQLDIGVWGTDLVDGSAAFPADVLAWDPAAGEIVGLHGSGAEERTVWRNPELAAVQVRVNEAFPGRVVRLMQWDDSRQVFLMRVTAAHDPGRWFVWHRADDRCVEYVRDGSFPAAEANLVQAFALERGEGVPLTGRLTRPRAGTGTSPPLLVWLRDAPWPLTPPGYRRESQAFAAMGFAVLEVEHRGTRGFGRAHVEAVRQAYDRVPLEDVLAAIAWGREQRAFDPSRIVVAGEGFGGYLAMRALEIHPDVFRAGAAVNAPMDLVRLFRTERDIEAFQRAAEMSLRASAAADRSVPGPETDGGGGSSGPPGGGGGGPGFFGGGPAPSLERERARFFFADAARQHIAVDDDLEALTQPVFLAHDPRLPAPAMAGAQAVRDVLTRRGQVVEWMEITAAYGRGDPGARADVTRRIGEFFQQQAGEAAAHDP